MKQPFYSRFNTHHKLPHIIAAFCAALLTLLVTSTTVSANNELTSQQQKVQVDMYWSLGCTECVPAIMTLLDYDIIFLRKNIDKKAAFKQELMQRAGSDTTPVIFINDKEIRSLSPDVLKAELRKAGAKQKPLTPKQENTADDSKF